MRLLPRKPCRTKRKMGRLPSTRNQCVFRDGLWVDIEEHIGSDARIPETPKMLLLAG